MYIWLYLHPHNCRRRCPCIVAYLYADLKDVQSMCESEDVSVYCFYLCSKVSVRVCVCEDVLSERNLLPVSFWETFWGRSDSIYPMHHQPSAWRHDNIVLCQCVAHQEKIKWPKSDMRLCNCGDACAMGGGFQDYLSDSHCAPREKNHSGAACTWKS